VSAVKEDRSVAPVESNGTTPAPNVIQALANVRLDLKGIGKDHKADPKQGGYAYRGIEDITAALGPLLGKHCVVFLPRVIEHHTKEIEVNTKPWTDTFLRVEYDIYGPGGLSDHVVAGPVLVIGRDNTDKGANKAMSQAYKQVLGQVFCIGDSKDDTDGQTAERDAPRQSAPDDPEQWFRDNGWADGKIAHDAYRSDSVALRNNLGAEARAQFRDWMEEHDHAFNRGNPRDEAEAIRKKLVELRQNERVLEPETGEMVPVDRPPDGPPLRREDLSPVPIPDDDGRPF
jgi:hypothetical protein